MLFGKYSALLLLSLSVFLRAWCSPELDKGKKLYAQHCAECHGASGEGVEDEFSKPLVGDWPIEKLTNYIGKTMPDYDPDEVKGKDAELVSRFIYRASTKNPSSFEKNLESSLPV